MEGTFFMDDGDESPLNFSIHLSADEKLLLLWKRIR